MRYPESYNDLVIELAIGTIARLKYILGPMTEGEFERSDCYWHVYDSDFEAGCDVLWRLGLAHGVARSRGQECYLSREVYKKYLKNADPSLSMPALFRFAEEDHIRQDFLIDAVNDPPTAEYMIEAYLRVATDYDPIEEKLPVSRDPFSAPTDMHVPTLKALANSGYAQEVDGKFIWTGKIGGAMIQMRHQWSAADADETLIDEDKVLDQSQAIIKTLNDPSARHPKWGLENCSMEFGAWVIMNFWNGESWTKKALLEPVVFFDDAIFIAKLLGDEM